MIDSRRKQLDDETLAQIRHEIGEIVTRYVDIEPENVEIKIILKDYICSNNTNSVSYTHLYEKLYVDSLRSITSMAFPR